GRRLYPRLCLPRPVGARDGSPSGNARRRSSIRNAGREPSAGDRAQRAAVSGAWTAVGDRGACRDLSAQAVSAARNRGRRALPAPRLGHPAAACRREPAAPRRGLRAGRACRRHARHSHGPLALRRGHAAAAREHRRADPGHRLCAVVLAVVRSRQYVGDPAGRIRLGVPDHLQHLDRGEGGQGSLGALGAGDGRGQQPPVPAGDPARRAALYPDRPAARARASLAHPGGGGIACRRALGPRPPALRRAPIPGDRRDARWHPGHRHHRARAGEDRVPDGRADERRARGHDAVMTALHLNRDRTRSILLGTATVLAVAALYELTARSGLFPRALMPTIPKIATTFVDLCADGTMFWHVFYTLYRMLTGFALAVVVGLPLGVLMGRFRAVENFFL